MTQEYGPGAQVNMPREMNGLAIGAFVLSIVGLCSPLGILALILGYVAKSQIKSRNNSGSGLATTAIILGWLSIIVILAFVVALAVGGWDTWSDRMEDYKNDYDN
ncbi:DUF4190 domain-containing protein [Glycomyces algeriensis]|uniref:DUF4190 domain-containing protein n=1 Tax=Glycomyces algeriensis TaxID=256037 RepID=A0A9W6GAW4_9ACTN|nr:DUF4190 domain-containing protein [Glycomyces algeriensis]MDA1368260.1 DUF4190 domain-containing protein [Glycomyces algeriensis]MDR7351900.1 hypothetical protein [Glycomyces algeriensis]GLI44630.1 hypothetical protein GALLR39Z86_44800 [Glycomyces algeriensis]